MPAAGAEAHPGLVRRRPRAQRSRALYGHICSFQVPLVSGSGWETPGVFLWLLVGGQGPRVSPGPRPGVRPVFGGIWK